MDRGKDKAEPLGSALSFFATQILEGEDIEKTGDLGGVPGSHVLYLLAFRKLVFPGRSWKVLFSRAIDRRKSIIWAPW